MPLLQSSSTGPLANEPGYDAHEVQTRAAGGAPRKQAKIAVRVGAPVEFTEDEKRKRIQPLVYEVAGEVRSWCGWCKRPIPGPEHAEQVADLARG